MNIYDYNIWWKTSQVPKAYTGQKREIFDDITRYLDYRQMLIFFGLRRAGKTTLLYQIINFLLSTKTIRPLNILYYTFDEQEHDLDRLVEVYQQEILQGSIAEHDRIYFLFDEVQKLDDWTNKVKMLYDHYPNIKIIMTGSAGLTLTKNTKESLAGRFFEFCIEPFSFDEFITFKDVPVDKTREHVYKREIINLYREYLKNGGFIEAVAFDEIALKKYIKESLLERVLYKDIPESFGLNRPQLLFRLLTIIAAHPGMYLDYKNLGNDVKVDQRTIAAYISYLEYSLLINKLYNYSGNMLTSEKKIKRIYLANISFVTALRTGTTDYSVLLENFYAGLFKARFFYRSPQKQEVDIITVKHDRLLPVEIKIKEKLRTKDVASVTKFMKHFQCERALVITMNDERVETADGRTITMLPYWRYWSILNEIYDG